MTKILAIDADVYAFRAAKACEREVKFEAYDMWTFAANEQDQRDALEGTIDRLLAEFKGYEPLLCYSGDTNFRYGVYPEYKSNRKASRKPLGYKALTEWSCEQWPFKKIDTIEGDDLLGIMATKFSDVVMVTIDKDLLTIPGVLYKGDKVVETSIEEADHYHLYQTLMGDPTDGYPGCPGVGKVTAAKLLKDSPTWGTVVRAYHKAGLTEEDALVQARCARILRSSEWDFTNKKVILWNPPN